MPAVAEHPFILFIPIPHCDKQLTAMDVGAGANMHLVRSVAVGEKAVWKVLVSTR